MGESPGDQRMDMVMENNADYLSQVSEGFGAALGGGGLLNNSGGEHPGAMIESRQE